MTELNFKLEKLEFEGPLDLMLLLIQKHKLNIQDIEITVLLDQFLLYLERMTEADIEVTAEFLDAAARLVLIKSAALLPHDEAEKMKKELQGALIEYALCKTMAERLKKRWIGDAVYVISRRKFRSLTAPFQSARKSRTKHRARLRRLSRKAMLRCIREL